MFAISLARKGFPRPAKLIEIFLGQIWISLIKHEMIASLLTRLHYFILSVQFPDYEDVDIVPEGTTEDGEIMITVSNPEKVGDGMGAYMVYTVTVKVSAPITSVSAFIFF